MHIMFPFYVLKSVIIYTIWLKIIIKQNNHMWSVASKPLCQAASDPVMFDEVKKIINTGIMCIYLRAVVEGRVILWISISMVLKEKFFK